MTDYNKLQVYPKTPAICLIDFEATCWENKKAPGPNGEGFVEPQMEIIEIGAVMLMSDILREVGLYQAFVKPKLNPVLSEFCKNLTTIRQENINVSPTFPEVLRSFVGWMRVNGGPKKDITFASWGFYDMKQLKLDCELHGVEYPFTDDHFNVKMYVGQKLWGGKGTGVSKAASRLCLPFDGTPHRGLDDARMISKILRRVEGK